MNQASNKPPAQRSVEHLQNLYTVIVGLAMSIAMLQFFGDDSGMDFLKWPTTAYLVTFLFTLVPFYHGALRHLDLTYFESPGKAIKSGALLADWSLLFVEACLFLAMARLIDNYLLFVIVWCSLLGLDVIWAFSAHLAFTPKPKFDLAE